jgi:CO/xanthine dehydrogenase FAD-binding subunit
VTVKNYLLPQSLEEAVGLLAEYEGDLLMMGGGTLAMPLINHGITAPETVMGLRQAGLDYVRHDNGALAIGATTTLSEMRENQAIPMLQEAAANTAAWTIRNMATVGGNLFAPPPAGDFAVALLALDAQLKLVGPAGQRLVPLADFYTGFLSNVMKPNELLAEVVVPLPQGKTAYAKFGRKQANTPAVVTVAAHLVFESGRVHEARLALNAVGPHPMRAETAESILKGSPLNEAKIDAAAKAAAKASRPESDALASAWYRRKMVNVQVNRVLTRIAEEGGRS